MHGSSRAEIVSVCGAAVPVGVAFCARYGQSEGRERKLGTPPADIAAMPDIPDIWQWCFPLRRQQAGTSLPVNAKAIGATKLQAITASTKLVTRRRMRIRER